MARNTAANHPFMRERDLKEGYVVMRVDDYYNQHVGGDRGGFMTPNYGQKGGILWPNYQMAENAAKHMVQKHPDHKYAVFKMISIVEAHQPVTVSKVV